MVNVISESVPIEATVALASGDTRRDRSVGVGDVVVPDLNRAVPGVDSGQAQHDPRDLAR